MEKFESSLPERQGELGRSPREHYEHLLKELEEVEAKNPGVPESILASMKDTKLKIIEAYKAEHPELNN